MAEKQPERASDWKSLKTAVARKLAPFQQRDAHELRNLPLSNRSRIGVGAPVR
jgi:hypothetical protein